MNEKLTVLAIDDDAGDARILRRNLENIPEIEFDFIHSPDPISGRQQLFQRDVDVTFVDYHFGANTSSDFIADVRTAGDLRPLIVLTGRGDAYVAAKLTRAGADEYIIKADLSPQTLKRAIDGAMAQFTLRCAATVGAEDDQPAPRPAPISRQAGAPLRMDSLTRLLNRAAWCEAAALDHARSVHHDQAYAVIVVDVDHLTAYNQSQGRLMGDLCLQQIAGALTRTLRAGDVLGRFNAGQFCVSLCETDLGTAATLATRICESVRRLALPHPLSPTGGRVTVSVGVASHQLHNRWEEVVQRASAAVGVAKKLGRDRASISSNEDTPTEVGALRRCLTVLVIEDDDGDAEILRRTLAEIPGYTFSFHHVVDRASAQSVLDALRVDVVFLDYTLGAVTGIDVLRELRADGNVHPVIVFTGQCNEYVAVELMRAGADDYITKSDVNADALRRAIESAIARNTSREFEAENRGLLDELRRKNTELQAKNHRLADLYETAHEFVDNVSHEFRTPLTVIKEFTSIMLDGLAGSTTDEQREYLAIVLHRADDLATMIDDMLDISKLEAGVLAVTRCAVKVSDIIAQVQPVLERKASAGRIRLELDFNGDYPIVYCDPEKIGRVLINLTVNAVKFSTEGSSVHLWARYEADLGQVRFGVKDHGPGIDPEQVSTLFERFKQLDCGMRSSTRGFGLGLNIANELVQLNFGDIDVNSDLGAGSTFSFTVPTADHARFIRRYLDRVPHFRGDASFVTLIDVQTTSEVPASLANEAQQFIQHQIRRCDLIFPIGPTHWILVAASNSPKLDSMNSRIQNSLQGANRNRLGDPLPSLDIKMLGTWTIAEEGEAFIQRFARAVIPRENPHV